MLLWLLGCQHFDNFVCMSLTSFSTYLTVIPKSIINYWIIERRNIGDMSSNGVAMGTGFVISQIVKDHLLSFNCLVSTQLKTFKFEADNAW